ncbi:MAG: tripartite tricarboxylate transporter substrate binding protein [Betaproteobacteria bacterium]|nr:tripartite tricarboxylate transporter substrate binding protein [Betaproteobacteria bacterium]
MTTGWNSLRALALQLAWVLACASLGSLNAAAQDLQNRPVSLVVGFPPGGSNDIVARVVAPKLAEFLGVSVVVVNKPGANATLGADYVAKSSPDGHTLLVSNAGPLVINPHTTTKMPYDALHDFIGVTTLAGTPEAIGVHPSVPARNLRELIEHAKSKSVSIASSGNGGMPHLVIEILRNAAQGSRILHVPYKGATLAANDVLGGHVEGLAGDLGSMVRLFKEGKLRAVAVTSRRRAEILPDVPTALEQGFPALVAENWIGLLAPAATPRTIVDKLHAALVKAGASQQMRDQFDAAGLSLIILPSPDAFQRLIRDEYQTWGKVVKDAGVRTD